MHTAATASSGPAASSANVVAVTPDFPLDSTPAPDIPRLPMRSQWDYTADETELNIDLNSNQRTIGWRCSRQIHTTWRRAAAERCLQLGERRDEAVGCLERRVGSAPLNPGRAGPRRGRRATRGAGIRSMQGVP